MCYEKYSNTDVEPEITENFNQLSDQMLSCFANGRTILTKSISSSAIVITAIMTRNLLEKDDYHLASILEFA